MGVRGLPGPDLHLFDFQYWYLHASDNIWEEGNHVIVAHGHICNDLLERVLLRGMIFVFLTRIGKFLS